MFVTQMGNTITMNIGNRGAVLPMSDASGGGGGGTNVSVGAPQEEEEEEVGCLEKLGCMLCGG
tara:strand:- start:546 stop:734 length:189 start_codon:yes stop_codon:yes gene_type:complete